ncbi:MAG: 2-oxoacid:acceptor oxidoreductase subunit alpha [Oscillospiraceae bacterium]|nr:2-oxoacid:acceptor oxidoreductase subunit alpha [Oscillospiraceae bacterium]
MRLKKMENPGSKLMQGNEACAAGALAADCKFMAGYPITPATEIPEYLSDKMFAADGVFMQMEDELASINAVIGASWGGARAMTATSGPGFTLMQEGIGYAIVTETPLVIINVMRGGPATGQPTCTSQDAVMQARYGGHGDYEIIALTPSSVQEAFDFTVRAFNLADKYRVPVLVLSDETVGHTREKLVIPESVEIFDERFEGKCSEYYKPDAQGVPPRIRFFEGHNVLVDGQLHDERGIRAGTNAAVCAAAIRRYCGKILDNADDICSTEAFFLDDAETVLVAYGSVSRSALSAVRRARAEGVKAGLLKLNTVWPVPEKQLRAACENAKRVIVPEMNVGDYAREVQRIAGCDRVEPFSSLGGVFPSPLSIYNKIVEVK